MRRVNRGGRVLSGNVVNRPDPGTATQISSVSVRLQLALAGVAICISACTQIAQTSKPSATIEDRTQVPPAASAGVDSDAAAPGSEPPAAAQLLLAQADTALAAQRPERAAALLERALRITPRDGRLWYQLALIRYRQQYYQQSMSLAKRAETFAGADAALKARCADLIDKAGRRRTSTP